MELAELMEAAPEVSEMDTLDAVLKRMTDNKSKAAAVIEGRRIVGIITAQDIARNAADSGRDPRAGLARDAMTVKVETMAASSPVVDAAQAMRARKIQFLALIDDAGDFVGMVSLRRVLFEVMDELGLKVDNLERELMADGPGG
jgi:CBS domain-containing protein